MKTEYESRPPPKCDGEPSGQHPPCMLVVVEGVRDRQFLRHISVMLHTHNPSVPDLAAREADGQLVFLPIGGGSIDGWSERLAPIGCREFHIYDRELPPETEIRQQAVQRIQSRPGCHAVLTGRRSLEGYLHTDAILAAGGPRVDFGRDDSVPERVARSAFEARHPQASWESLSRRAHKRLANLAKEWLNTRAVDCMTPELLRQSDPRGDILTWLATIDALAGWQA